MNFAAEREALAQPLLDANLGIPILMPGRQANAPDPSGDATSPTRYVIFDARYVGSDYHTFANDRHLRGLVELTIYCEAIAGDGPIRRLVDSIETAYRTASVAGVTFRSKEAVPDPQGEESGFLRWDWRLPYWRFPS